MTQGKPRYTYRTMPDGSRLRFRVLSNQDLKKLARDEGGKSILEAILTDVKMRDAQEHKV